MTKEIFDSLPYVSRMELIELRKLVNSIALANDETVSLRHPSGSVEYEFNDRQGSFAFNIEFRGFDGAKYFNSYAIYFRPQSPYSMEGAKFVCKLNEIPGYFNTWISLVKKIHEVTQEYFDPFQSFYDREFSGFFSNNDDDAEINPFELPRQELIFNFLTYAENKIKMDESMVEDAKKQLLLKISGLKNDVPNVSKKRFVLDLSKFAQSVKKASNKLFHDIFDVLKKEAIKKILYGGVDNIQDIIHKIDWHNIIS